MTAQAALTGGASRRAGLFSVSIDLDGVGCYAAIHGLGLGALSVEAQRAVPITAVDRFCELLARHGLRGTLFAIGRELDLPGAEEPLRRAAGAGHEVASHSFGHDYALSRRSQVEIEADLLRAESAITAATGQRPRGFRAPGYTLSPALLAALRARGYCYDSSLLPSAPYYLAKAVAIGLRALRGRRSESILGGVGQLFGSRGAHLRAGVRELPISTLPLLRGPVIGTVVAGLPEALSARFASWAFASGHFNLELHGIDLLDQSDGVPPALAAVQPGLRVPAKDKLRRISALLAALRASAEGCTLEDAAKRLLPG